MDQIRGRSYEEALMLLEYMPFRACEPVLKTLVSVRTASWSDTLTRAGRSVSKRLVLETDVALLSFDTDWFID